MRMLRPLLFLAACCALLSPVGAREVAEVSEASPGRSGICVTEMPGGERVEIPLTVLGVIGGGTPDGELVLVRLDDPRFAKTGIIAGMSGSPVYLDGKLLGALAYGWPFATEPIGGVTPFTRMLKIDEPRPAATAAATRPELAEVVAAASQLAVGELLLDWLLPGAAAQQQPLPMAVSATGAAGLTVGGWLDDAWKRLGWIATPGGGSASGAEGRPLQPGAMVAVVLVDGDATLAAGGTVTEVQDDRVWAFGHASLGAGSSTFPLARAEVVAVLPSLMSSSKLFAVGEPLGAIVADRRDGIVGRLGGQAPMVPVTVGADDRSYSFSVVDHPVLLPLLAAYLTQTGYAAEGRSFGYQTVVATVELRHSGLEPVAVKVGLSGAGAVAEAAAFVGAVVAYLEGSPFAGPPLASVHVALDSAEELRGVTILEVVPERRVVRPGETLRVRFRLKPHRGPEEVRIVELRVPEGLPDGRLDLVGADGAAWTAYDLQMRPRPPASFADELRLLASLQPSTTLVAAFERPDVGVAVTGGSMSTPPGIAMQLSSALGPNVKAVSHSVVAETALRLDRPVTGAQRIPLTVRSDGGTPE